MNSKRMMVAVLGIMCVVWSAQAAWLDGWKHRREIVINAGKVDADLTNFPVMVRLESLGLEFSQARPDGYDLRFTAVDGTTELDFERELHDANAWAGVYWVKLPLVSSEADTRFYVYYGNSAAGNAANPSAVWDSDHYAVWHLNQTNGATQADSTAGANNLVQWPGFELGEVAISDCDSSDNWLVDGTNATLSLDTEIKDTNVGSAASVKMTVSEVEIGQTNALICTLSTPIALGDRAVNFYFNDSVYQTHCSALYVYVYDTSGNARRQSVERYWYAGAWRKYYAWVGRGGTIIGSAPDMNSIDKIVIEVVAANTSAYSVNIDTLFGNGGLHEGQRAAIGDGVEFYGYNNALRKATPNIATSNLTLSVWARPDDAAVPKSQDDDRQYLLSMGGGNWSPYWKTYLAYANGRIAEGFSVTQKVDPDKHKYQIIQATSSAGVFSVGEWNHFAATYQYDASTNTTTVTVYVNGKQVAQKSAEYNQLAPVLSRSLWLGVYQHESSLPWRTQGYFSGGMDEVRVSTCVRSESWLKACHDNQAAASTFLSRGVGESTEAWMAGWSYRRKLVLNSTQVDEDLEGFPALVRLTSENFDFDAARSDGGDIRFTDASGGALEFEQEMYDAATQCASYWVKLPLVSSTADTSFYVYYGNSAAQDNANPTGVWDSDYCAVWHLNETNGVTQADSTSSGRHLTQWPGFELGEVAISDCDSISNWSESGDNASLSLDTTVKDESVGSVASVKMTVSAVAIGQTNALVYIPSEPIALGNRAVNFYFSDSVYYTHCNNLSVYVYDTNGNVRQQSLNPVWSAGAWRKCCAWAGSDGTIIGSAPDMDNIAKIVIEIVAKTASAYSVNIDTLFGNGGLHEGHAAPIGKGVEFYGYNNALQGDSLGISTSNLTISVWARPDQVEVPYGMDGNTHYLLSMGGGNWAPFWMTYLGYVNGRKAEGYTATANNLGTPVRVVTKATSPAEALPVGEWAHVAATYRYDSGTDITTVLTYVNGTQVAQASAVGNQLAPKFNRPVWLGMVEWNIPIPFQARGYFAGGMDEARLSTSVRSEAWLRTSYANQVADSSLISVGSREPPYGTVLLLR